MLTRCESLGSLCNKRNNNGIHLLLSLVAEVIWDITQGFSVPLQALECLDCKNLFFLLFLEKCHIVTELAKTKSRNNQWSRKLKGICGANIFRKEEKVQGRECPD